MNIARTIALTVAGGLLMAWVLFSFRPGVPLNFGHLGGVIGRGPETIVEPAGYDLWTGIAHGETVTYEDLATGQQVTETKVPPYSDGAGSRAIPVPVGFAAGCLVTLVVLVAAGTTRRTAPASAA